MHDGMQGTIQGVKQPDAPAHSGGCCSLPPHTTSPLLCPHALQQVQQAITVVPTTNGAVQPPGQASNATATMRVTGCDQATLTFATARLTATKAYNWGVQKTAASPTELQTRYNAPVTINYEVAFTREDPEALTYSAEAVIQISNPSTSDLVLGFVQVEVALDGADQQQQPAHVNASCPLNKQGRVVAAARSATNCTFSWEAPSTDANVALRLRAFTSDGKRVEGPVVKLSWDQAVAIEVCAAWTRLCVRQALAEGVGLGVQQGLLKLRSTALRDRAQRARTH